MAVTAGNLIENSAAVQAFVDAVQTPAHNTIVYHSTEKHTPTTGVDDSQAPPDANYAADNPDSGASVAGIGADGTTITALTVYNHLIAASGNITNIRQCKVRWLRQIDPTTSTEERGSADGITVRDTGQRQTMTLVNSGGVTAGEVADAADFNNLCTNLFDAWNTLKDNRADFDVTYCHNSCHTSCHSSRGRR